MAEKPALLLEKVSSYYNYLMVDLADERTNDWFLIKSPFPLLCLLAFYLYFVKTLGPRLMEHRKPFELKKTLIIYNLFQVLLSIWLFVESLDGAWLYNYSWKCQPIDRTRSPLGMRAATGTYIFFWAKISELLDTVFFILRKKNNQATFLHLYHHTGMPIFAWFGVKYLPGGHGLFVGLINSFVHIIMYTYYMLAGLGPEIQKYLWWKKYITKLQLLQFCLGTLHASQLIFYDCGYPRWTVFIFLPNGIFFYYLFNEFYKDAYSRRRMSKKQLETDSTNSDLEPNNHVLVNHPSSSNSEKQVRYLKKNKNRKSNKT